MSAAAFGREPTRQPDTGELAQTLLKLLLQFIEPRPLLRDLGLRLGLYCIHPRAHRTHLVVDQGVHAIAHLFFRRRDLFAKHRAQSRRDRLIEIRPHHEVWMMQRPGKARLDVEIRDAGHSLPD